MVTSRARLILWDNISYNHVLILLSVLINVRHNIVLWAISCVYTNGTPLVITNIFSLSWNSHNNHPYSQQKMRFHEQPRLLSFTDHFVAVKGIIKSPKLAAPSTKQVETTATQDQNIRVSSCTIVVTLAHLHQRLLYFMGKSHDYTLFGSRHSNVWVFLFWVPSNFSANVCPPTPTFHSPLHTLTSSYRLHNALYSPAPLI